MNWNSPAIRRLIAQAVQEDHAQDDATSRALMNPQWKVQAVLIAKEKGVIAGLPLAAKLFKAIDPSSTFKMKVTDGARVRPGTILAAIEGRAIGVLAAERPALNALQHLSGIATFTRRMVDRLKGTKTRLFDTRKTLPGWRALQKYAVQCGGGTNHRLSLADAILIKDNHLKISRLAGDNWVVKTRRVMQSRPSLPVQVEIQTRRDLEEVLFCRPKLVLLDNFPFKKLRPMIKTLRENIPGVQIEISGGVRPEDLRPLSRLGVERISMGRLTHSVQAFDCSLDITHVHPR